MGDFNVHELEYIPVPQEPLDLSLEVTGFKLLDDFRALVRREITAQLARDGYHKRHEGAVFYSVELPPVVDWREAPDPFGKQTSMRPLHKLCLYCYVLGPARQYEWKGDTAAAVFRDATNDFLSWVAEAIEEAGEVG